MECVYDEGLYDECEYAASPPCVYDEALYGECEYSESPLQWLIDIDWNGDGALERQTERVVGLKITRGRQHPLQSDGKGLEKIRPGRADLTLLNDDRRYDPFYAGSDLYPNVRPGRDCRIRVRDDTETYEVFRGSIDDIVPLPREKQIRLTVLDGWAWLEQRSIRLATRSGQRTDQLISAVLEAATYPWGESLNEGSDTVPYWWSSDESAADAVRELSDSEFGIAFVHADGAFGFLSRASGYNAAEALTLTDDIVLQDVVTPMPWDAVRNIAQIVIHPQQTLNFATLWESHEVVPIPYGATRTFLAKLTYQNHEAALIEGEHGGNGFDMNTAPDGSGALIGDPDISSENFGALCLVTVTNNTVLGVSGYLLELSVAGAAVYAPAEHVVEDDQSLGSAFGPRVLTLDLKWQQDSDRARSFARLLTTLFGAPRLQPVVKLENRVALQFGYDLATLLTYQSDYLGIDNQFRVMGIEHEWLTPNGQRVVTSWRLEPADSTQYWVLGVSELGTETVLAY